MKTLEPDLHNKILDLINTNVRGLFREHDTRFITQEKLEKLQAEIKEGDEELGNRLLKSCREHQEAMSKSSIECKEDLFSAHDKSHKELRRIFEEQSKGLEEVGQECLAISTQSIRSNFQVFLASIFGGLIGAGVIILTKWLGS